MPEKTLEATFDHGDDRGRPGHGATTTSPARCSPTSQRLGISYDDVTALLEKEGVEKFVVSWNELLDTVSAALEAAK